VEFRFPGLNLFPGIYVDADGQVVYEATPFLTDSEGRIWFDPVWKPEKLETWTEALAAYRKHDTTMRMQGKGFARGKKRPLLNLLADGSLRRLETVVYCAVERICALMMIEGGGKKVRSVPAWRDRAQNRLATDLHATARGVRKELIVVLDDGGKIRMRGLWWPTAEDGCRLAAKRFSRLDSLRQRGGKKESWQRMYPNVKRLQARVQQEIKVRFSPVGKSLTAAERTAIENEILFQIALVRPLLICAERARRLSSESGDFHVGIAKHGAEHVGNDKLYTDKPLNMANLGPELDDSYRPADVLLAAYSGINPAFIFTPMAEFYEEFETMRGLGCLQRNGEFEFSNLQVLILGKYIHEIANHEHTGWRPRITGQGRVEG